MSELKKANFSSVFFDLDGTLADTAPDLAAAANKLRTDRKLEPIPLEQLRPATSAGARGLIQIAFGLSPEDPEFEALKNEFFINYENALHVHSYIFEEMETVLELLEIHQVPWGIVTNKHQRFTNPLVKSMGLDIRAHATVSGDTTEFAKPHPAPILHAAKLSKVDPKDSIYVGDDERDIIAGKAAGMKTVAAAYGYCGNETPPEDWGADFLVHSPIELIDILFAK